MGEGENACAAVQPTKQQQQQQQQPVAGPPREQASDVRQKRPEEVDITYMQVGGQWSLGMSAAICLFSPSQWNWWLIKLFVVAPPMRHKHTPHHFNQYRDENDLPLVMHLIDNELSEPYSIFTYRWGAHQAPAWRPPGVRHCMPQPLPLLPICSPGMPYPPRQLLSSQLAAPLLPLPGCWPLLWRGGG